MNATLAVKRLAAALRDAWLVVGICLAIVLVLEFGFRAIETIHGATLRSAAPDPTFPYAGQAWYRGYAAEDTASMSTLAWQPFVEMRRAPFHGSYITVERDGLRRTVNPVPRSPATREVFVFGGSTMWGTGQRDSMTLASLIAKGLAASGAGNLRVKNFGQTGYILTQQVLDLVLQLRAGARPAAVIFYNGINDVAAAAQNGRPGIPINDFHRARDFDMGRTLFNPSEDLTSESRAFLRMGLIAAGRSHLLRRFQRPGGFSGGTSDDSLIGRLAQRYWSTVDLVEALGDHYGFTAFYFWQPTLHNTSKPLTPWERSLRAALDADPLKRRLIPLHARVPGRIDAGAAAMSGRFFDLSDLFAHDSASVYIDDIGHVTETANVVIAGAITRAILGTDNGWFRPATTRTARPPAD